MRIMQRLGIVLFAAVTVTACQSYSPPSLDSWLARPQVGSTLVLHQDLEVPLGRSRVYLQLGQVKPRKDVNEYKPYCYFYLRRPREELDNPMVITADEFIIEEVYRRRNVVQYQPQQFAFLLTGVFDAGNSQHTMATYSEIRSPKQPQVTRLVCAVWDDPMEYNHVSLAETIKALGGIAIISEHK